MSAARPQIVCIGGATIDAKYRTHQPLQPGTSNPASCRRSFGGVARNVAETLARLGVRSSLLAAIGDDENGRALLRHLQASGVETGRILIVPGAATAHYVAVLDADNNLAFGLADMELLETVTIADIDRAWPMLAAADWIFADCNLSRPVLSHLLVRRRDSRFRLAIDTVSTRKATRLPDDLRGLDLLFLNEQEAASLLARSGPAPDQATALLSRGAASVVLTSGAAGLLVAEPGRARLLPGLPVRVVDVTGAGDALIAATLSRLLLHRPLVESCRIGMLAALLTIESEDSVTLAMSPELLDRSLSRLAPRA